MAVAALQPNWPMPMLKPLTPMPILSGKPRAGGGLGEVLEEALESDLGEADAEDKEGGEVEGGRKPANGAKGELLVPRTGAENGEAARKTGGKAAWSSMGAEACDTPGMGVIVFSGIGSCHSPTPSISMFATPPDLPGGDLGRPQLACTLAGPNCCPTANCPLTTATPARRDPTRPMSSSGCWQSLSRGKGGCLVGNFLARKPWGQSSEPRVGSSRVAEAEEGRGGGGGDGGAAVA